MGFEAPGLMVQGSGAVSMGEGQDEELVGLGNWVGGGGVVLHTGVCERR